jgi:hypothetical protein
MRHPGGPSSPGTGERVPLDSAAVETPNDQFGSDLAHLFDYCRTLLGQDAEAIRTARSVLSSPHEPLPDRDRHRAWLFGLARSLARALRPPGDDEPSYLPVALIAEAAQQIESGVQRAFRSLTDRDREILDLVHRHSIRPADLPVVLIVPAEEVYRRLVDAEAEFINRTAGPEACLGANLKDIADLPLAALPADRHGIRGGTFTATLG